MAKRHYTEQQRQAHNEYVAEAKRRRNAHGAEIGEIPPVGNPERRADAERSLAKWAAVYCAHRHRNPDSKNHATMYAALDRAIASPETWLALQAPRGEAKSFKSSEALLYAVMTGKKKFVCCFTSSMSTTETLAQYLEGQFLCESGPFWEDYPEVFAALDTQGAYAQRKVTYQGKDVNMAWGALLNGKKVYKFPRIKGCASSGAIIVLQSITSKIRGMGIVDETGVPIRPDLILIDDVQDYEVSQNPNRVEKYLEKTDKDILGLSGDDPLSMIVLGTPFHKDCYMSKIMRDKRFDGITLKSIYSFPTHMDLWEEYRKKWESIYDETLLRLGPLEKRKSAEEAYKASSAFYTANRVEMDEGCEISWPARYEKKYSGASAVENIMREYLLILREEAFNQEKQCLVVSKEADIETLDEERFLSKCSKTLPEWVSPDWASKLTAAIDVHGNVLYWTLAAWGPGFDGHTLSYGTWPKQPRSSWKQARVPHSLRSMYKGSGDSGALRSGLEDLVKFLLTQTYRREDGSEIYVEKIIIDNNNGLFKKTVTNFIKESEFREKLVGYIADWYSSGHQPRKKTEEGGMEWKYTPDSHRREIIAFRDYWKAFALSRWLTPVGDSGCMTVYKGGPTHHRRFYSELTAKKYHPVVLSSGKSILRWDDKSDGDDHYGDCDTMNFIAANIVGIGQAAETDVKRKRIRRKLSEIQKRKMNNFNYYE